MARSTSQPQFFCENTPSLSGTDQILLAPQQLGTNSNSANFNINVTRTSKLTKSLTTTMPTFDGKSEKFELNEDLFQTGLKIYNPLTAEDKINYYHSFMRGDALQTFKNITSPNKEVLGEFLHVFRKKIREPSVNGYSKTQISTIDVQSSEPDVKWFSRRTPKPSERRTLRCHSGNHLAILLCQNASLPEEINQRGAFGQ